MANHWNFLMFLVLVTGLAILLLFLSYVLAVQEGDSQKSSPYECGFEPFEDASQPFGVPFFLVALLFLIFDLEVAYFFPWTLVVNGSNYVVGWMFLSILTLGLIYEWKEGGLEWQ